MMSKDRQNTDYVAPGLLDGVRELHSCIALWLLAFIYSISPHAIVFFTIGDARLRHSAYQIGPA